MYTVTALARAAGTTPDAVRHYTALGLLAPERDRHNSYRRYGRRDLERLAFIRASRELGFSLADVQAILAEADRGDAPCPQVRRLYQQRLAAVEAEVTRLQGQARHMRRLLRDWEKLPDCAPDGHRLCHLIEGAAHAAGAEGNGHD